MKFQGLPKFFKYMNAQYPDSWFLVGGAAAWVYIAGAKRKQVAGKEDVTVLANIFPQDIDVVVKDQGAQAKVHEVECGRFKMDVDFVADSSHGTLFDVAKTVGEAKVLPIQDIINKYTIATSKKPQVRTTRVALLKKIKAGEEISLDEALKIFQNTTESTNPLLAAIKARKK